MATSNEDVSSTASADVVGDDGVADDAEAFVWDESQPLTAEEKARLDERRGRGAAGQALGAAMTAVGEIFDPSMEHQSVAEQQVDDDDEGFPIDLDFRGLPPL
ncbi:MAG: hypothetical protein ACKVKO_11190 [Acidimicrobiales bacterium]|jgi:hypothetical protein